MRFSFFYLVGTACVLSGSIFAQEKLSPSSVDKKNLQEAKIAGVQASREYDQGHFTAAEKEYEKALALVPHDTEYLNHLAAVEVRLNKPQDAEKLLRASLQQKLENPFAWLLLGMTYLHEERIDDAFAALVQATHDDPKNPRAQHYLGIVAGRKGWHEMSETSLRKAIELDPNYADAHFNLAVYYLQRNPPAIEVARRHYQRALELGAAHDPTIDALMKKSLEKDSE